MSSMKPAFNSLPRIKRYRTVRIPRAVQSVAGRILTRR